MLRGVPQTRRKGGAGVTINEHGQMEVEIDGKPAWRDVGFVRIVRPGEARAVPVTYEGELVFERIGRPPVVLRGRDEQMIRVNPLEPYRHD